MVCVMGGTDLIENQKSENFYRQNNFSLHTPFGFPETAVQEETVRETSNQGENCDMSWIYYRRLRPYKKNVKWLRH